MKLTGELKDKVEQTKDLEEAKAVIAEAGMLLSDEEASAVAGGFGGQGEHCNTYSLNAQEVIEDLKKRYPNEPVYIHTDTPDDNNSKQNGGLQNGI